MFVAIADLTIKPDKIEEYKQTFSESNKLASKFDGFISRRLLESQNGTHRILVEFEDDQKYLMMHQNHDFDQLQIKSFSFLEEFPTPLFYKLVAE